MARILIVEDEPTDQRLLQAVFEGSVHKVYLTRGGEQAYKAYLNRGFDLVITDLQMPNVDGIELIQSIKALFPDTPIIAISGKGPSLLARAKAEGACAALSKPIDRDVLLSAVGDALPSA